MNWRAGRRTAIIRMKKEAPSQTKRPLSGVRILVGRARHQAGALSAELRKFGATVLEIPFIEIRRPRSYKPLDSALRNISAYDWLILTSVNGVEAMWERIGKLKLKQADLTHLRVAAIGPATKKTIEQRRVKVDVVPKEYVAESVVRSLQRRVKGKRVLLVRAKVARDVIPRELRKAGAQVNVVEAYETVVPRASRRRLRSTLANPGRRPNVHRQFEILQLWLVPASTAILVEYGWLRSGRSPHRRYANRGCEWISPPRSSPFRGSSKLL
jgi:uroporphyrinogen-III synthase